MTRRCHIQPCNRAVTVHITGSRLPRGGVDACPAHYEDVLERAGQWPAARLIRAEQAGGGQEALFEMPDADKGEVR